MKKTWFKESLSNSWENEIQLNNNIYYAQCDYDLDYTIDEGDDLTPPDTTINNINLNDVQIYAYNDETGEFDIEITEQNSPTLYKSLVVKLEEEIISHEYERL